MNKTENRKQKTDTDTLHPIPKDTLHAYAAILDKVGTYVYTKNIQGQYTYANQLVCDLFERTLTDVIGLNDKEIFGIKDGHDLLMHDADIFRYGKSFESIEELFIKSLNETRTFVANKSPILNDDGKVVGLIGVSTDITDRVRLERKAVEQSALLDTVFSHLEDFIGLKDSNCRYLFINKAGADKLGTEIATAIGKTDKEILQNDSASEFDQLDRECLDTGQKISKEIVVERTGYNEYFWAVRLPLQLQDGSKGVIGISTNVTELSELKEEFKKLANTDVLTGISNRRHILDTADLELKRMHRWHETMAVLVIDIDSFKSINDTHGHHMGDEAIIQIISACKRNIRDIDWIGRTGGDEFLVISPKCTKAEAEQLASRLHAAVNSVLLQGKDGKPIRLTCSFGCVVSKPTDTDFGFLLSQADIAMYNSKSSGRNTITFG